MLSKSVLVSLTAAAFALAIPGSSLAQSVPANQPDQTCPVQLTALRIHDNKLLFRDKNKSDLYIKKIAFGAAYLDADNVPHRIEVQGGWKDLHAGYTLNSALDIKNYRKTGYSGWVIWPEKVLYKDGTLWQISQDDQSCGMQTTNAVKDDVPMVPAELIEATPTRDNN